MPPLLDRLRDKMLEIRNLTKVYDDGTVASYVIGSISPDFNGDRIAISVAPDGSLTVAGVRMDRLAEQYGTPGNYINGANIAGFLKVANAMMDQGVL